VNLSYSEWLLALCLWREARGEGEAGMRAVGHVIRNRVFAGQGDWITVITAPLQFTSINPPKSKEGWPKDAQTVRFPQNDDLRWLTATQLAHAIFAGQDEDPTGVALYYANLANIDPGGWFERTILGNPAKYPQSAVIGRHSFFRELS